MGLVKLTMILEDSDARDVIALMVTGKGSIRGMTVEPYAESGGSSSAPVRKPKRYKFPEGLISSDLGLVAFRVLAREGKINLPLYRAALVESKLSPASASSYLTRFHRAGLLSLVIQADGKSTYPRTYLLTPKGVKTRDKLAVPTATMRKS